MSFSDTIHGGRKADRLFMDKTTGLYEGGPYLVYGHGARDMIRGSSSDDWLEGGDGNDHFVPNLGADTIVGGPGKDTIIPHDGEDTIILQYNFSDYIFKFKQKSANNGQLMIKPISKSHKDYEGNTKVKLFERRSFNTRLQFRDLVTDIGAITIDQSPTPEPTPQPTPEPTPAPTPEPTPQPTPEPTPETYPPENPPADKGPQNFWDTESLYGAQWGHYNFGQSLNSLPAGVAGEDSKINAAFSRLPSQYGQIPNLNLGQNIIGIVDSGVRLTHYDLLNKVIAGSGYDFVNNDWDPTDDHGHGTHVAGIAAAAANNFGMLGSNPVAKIIPVKVLDNQNSGTSWDIANGIRHAILKGAKVINSSIGRFSEPNATEYEWYKYLDAHHGDDVLIVWSAGNDGSYIDGVGIDAYPGSYPFDFFIQVGNHNQYGQISATSNYGPAVDVYAPGSSIYSAGHLSDNHYQYKSGTSMAAPLVAGMLSYYWANIPDNSSQGVKNRLLNSYRYTFVVDDRPQVDAELFFFGDSRSSAFDDSTVEELSNDLSGDQSLRNSFDDLQPAIRLDTIDDFDFQNTSLEFIASLNGDNSRRSEVAKRLVGLTGRTSSVYKAIDEIEVAWGDRFVNIRLDEVDDNVKRELLRRLLQKEWFAGFDLNEIYEVPVDNSLALFPRNTVRRISAANTAEQFTHVTVFNELDNDVNKVAGDNFVAGGPGADIIYAGSGNDLIMGDQNDDQLFGNNGNDELIGGKGSDTLNGGRGADTLQGGKGSDYFVPSRGYNEVVDFEIGTDSVLIDNGLELISATQDGNDFELSYQVGSDFKMLRLKDTDGSLVDVVV